MGNDQQLIPIPKIILEGTSLTMKTDISFAIAEHPRIVGQRKHRWHIPLVSSEWETFSDEAPTKSNPGRSLITFNEYEKAKAFDAYETWLRMFELHREYYWVVDRFHISTQVHQLLYNGLMIDFKWLEERLTALGFFLIDVVRDPDTYEEARQVRMEYSENPHRYTDLKMIASQSSIYTNLIEKSTIPSVQVDISDNDVERAANEILDFVEQSGGFWSRPWAL